MNKENVRILIEEQKLMNLSVYDVCEFLERELPHGFGINGAWSVSHVAGLYQASNEFEARDENGMYCHYFPFTAFYQIVEDNFVFQDIVFEVNPDEYECCGLGLSEYLSDTLYEVVW